MPPATAMRCGEVLDESRHIIALAWPVMLTSLNWTLMQLIDVAVVGHAGARQLGFLAAGRTLTFITIVMGLAAMSGILVFSARADGAGWPAETGAWLRRGILFALLLGLPCMVVLILFAGPLLRLLGVPGEIAGGGAAVTRAMALAYPFQFVQIATSYFLEGISQPRRVMAINLAMLPLNAILAWAWAGGHLGLPAAGAVGAVLATACISAIGAVGMLTAAWTLSDAAERGVRRIGRADWAAAWHGLPALFRFGLVPAISSGLELVGFSWLIVLSTRLGPVPAAAFQAVFSLHNFAFAMALGFASAGGVRIANAVGSGAKQLVRPRSLIAIALGVAAMGSVGFLLWAVGPRILPAFSDDPAVLRTTGLLLVVMAPFMWLDGLQMVCVYVLRSLGDQVAAGINGVIAFFIVTGGLGSLLVAGGYGPPALIHAFIAGVAAAALLQGGRLLILTRRMSRG